MSYLDFGTESADLAPETTDFSVGLLEQICMRLDHARHAPPLRLHHWRKLPSWRIMEITLLSFHAAIVHTDGVVEGLLAGP